VTITNSEAANDRLVINGLGGDDVIKRDPGLAPGSIQLTVDGGDGNDILIGSRGNDTLIGGPRRRQSLSATGGQDILDGGPGGKRYPGGRRPLPLLSQFMASSFATASGSTGAMPIVDQHTNQPPLLAQPHA